MPWAFLGVWVVVALGLLTFWVKKRPTKASMDAINQSPTANKINSVICAGMLVAGVVGLYEQSPAFTVVWAVLVSGMLVMFIRRGWFSRSR